MCGPHEDNDNFCPVRHFGWTKLIQIDRFMLNLCVQVAQTMKCRSIDLFGEMINKDLSLYLSDGLHLSDEGNRFLASLLEPLILQLTDHLPMNLPDWKDL